MKRIKPEYVVDNDKYKYKKKLHWLTIVLFVVDFCAVVCFGLWYIPNSPFRNWFVTTAMATGSHQYLAYIFYNDQMISNTLSSNKVISQGENTNVSDITFIKTDTSQGYKSIYEQQVLENPDNVKYKVIEIAEDNWKGWLCVVYEPTKLNLAICKGWRGDRCTTIAERYNAPVVVNGGRFYRAPDKSIYPIGTVISSNNYISRGDEKNYMIGMNQQGVLILNYGDGESADKYNLKWACEMGPFLIVNGEKTKFSGNGGYGIQPRTAIGQRKDGVVIFLVIDGRQLGSSGVSIVTLADIFEKYGCINAANLDGGGSSTLVVNGKLTNNPQNDGKDFERYVYNAIYLEP